MSDRQEARSAAKAALDELLAEHDRFRAELMRCGSLAVSDRADGCIPKSRALQIREIAYRTCWPEEAESNG